MTADIVEHLPELTADELKALTGEPYVKPADMTNLSCVGGTITFWLHRTSERLTACLDPRYFQRLAAGSVKPGDILRIICREGLDLGPGTYIEGMITAAATFPQARVEWMVLPVYEGEAKRVLLAEGLELGEERARAILTARRAKLDLARQEAQRRRAAAEELEHRAAVEKLVQQQTAALAAEREEALARQGIRYDDEGAPPEDDDPSGMKEAVKRMAEEPSPPPRAAKSGRGAGK